MLSFRSCPFLILSIAAGFPPCPVSAEVAPAELALFFPGPDGAGSDLRIRNVAARETVEYHINNYAGDMVSGGHAMADEHGVLTVPASVSPGYYELALSRGAGDETAFPFLRLPPLPANGEGSGGEAFFSIDAALSWLVSPEKRAARIASLPQVIRGGLARERFSWGEIHPAPDRRDWEADRRYETARRDYAAGGVKLLEMFHSVPAWMERAQNGKFPRDLPVVARSFGEIAMRWHGYWGALEVWNEPDISFGGNQPADQYVPIVKTVRHALRASGVDTPIVGGGFAYLTPDFLHLSARNGLLDESDIISFHYYGDPLGLERHTAEVRAWLREHDRESKPLWITEVGRLWRGDGNTGPTISQQRETALALAMQGVEARACGIGGWFPFVYANYNEHGYRNYGMTDERGLPLRPLAAVAQASRILAGTAYAGDLDPPSGQAGAKRIRVFSTSSPDEALLVAYTGAIDDGATLSLPFAVKSAHGVDGREIETRAGPASPGASVPVPDGLVYIVADRLAVSRLLRTDTEAMRLTRIAGEAPPPALEPSPIVLQSLIDLDAAKVTAVTRGYLLPAGDKVRVPVALRVNNLSDETHAVSVSHALKDGESTPPRSSVVEPGEYAEMVFDIDPAVLPRDGGGAYSLVFSAVSDDVRRIAPAALSLIPSLGLGEHLGQHPYQFALPVGERHRWRDNANGNLVFEHQAADATWGFRVSFAGGDRWAYPRFTLPQEVDLKRVSGVLLRARCARRAVVRIMSWDENDKGSFTAFSIFPADGEWHVAYVPLSSWIVSQGDLPPGLQLRDISIGINSHENENEVEVSDFYLIGR